MNPVTVAASDRAPAAQLSSSDPAEFLEREQIDNSQFQTDIVMFGTDAAVALRSLSSHSAALNRGYRIQVQQRSLRVLPEIQEWSGRQVQVFLRHDSVYVFAIAFNQLFGMANHVELTAAELNVDPEGRRQTLSKCGPLANLTSVHAYVTGTLTRITDGTEHPDLTDWIPVVYRPADHVSFVCQKSGCPVHHAASVLMIPGDVKVWCQGLTNLTDATDSRLRVIPPNSGTSL